MSKSARNWQGRPSRGTPTPPGYGYLTHHLPRKVTLARISDSATDEQVLILETRGKKTQLYNTTIRCLGLGGRKNIRILQTNCSCRFRHRQREQQHPRCRFHLWRNLAWPRMATRAEGSPPQRRTPAPRLGHRSQGLLQGPDPSGHLVWPLRSLSQLSPEDISPAHGLGSVTPRLVPLTDDLAKLQPPLLHLLGLGCHLLLGRRSLFLSRLCLCPRRHRSLRLQLIAERPKVLKLSKRGLEWQGRPSRGTPTPPGYVYLTRHLPRKATHTRLSGSASRQASPSARMRKKHGITLKYPDVQASTATMNIHPHSGCHYKRNSGSTPTGMNYLHTRGPVEQQTPGSSPTTVAPTARQRPPSRMARQQQRWPQGERYRWKALVHVPSRGTRTSN
jgi:hypothetical protein